MGWQIQYSPFLFAGDTIINQAGVFIYNGAPALGNLKVSIAGQSGTDQFGNVYNDNVTTYNVAVAGGGFAQLASNPVSGIPFLVLRPPGTTNLNAAPQISGQVGNPGAVNEYELLALNSGSEVGNIGPSQIEMFSRSNDSTLQSAITMLADQTSVTLLDNNNYPFGELSAGLAADFTVNSTTLQDTGLGFNVAARRYRVQGFCRFTAAATGVAQSMHIGFNGTATTSSMIVYVNAASSAQGTTHNPGEIGALNTAPSVNIGPVANSVVSYTWWDGYIVFSAAGTFHLYAAVGTSAADETFTLSRIRTWLTLTPA